MVALQIGEAIFLRSANTVNECRRKPELFERRLNEEKVTCKPKTTQWILVTSVQVGLIFVYRLKYSVFFGEARYVATR